MTCWDDAARRTGFCLVEATLRLRRTEFCQG
jgi:hypothetical protein